MQRFRLKLFLRWLVLAAVVFFLLRSLQTHWQEVTQLRISAAGVACLAIALGVTLFAHIFAGFVWSWILRFLSYPVSGSWGAQTYLKTNIAKYLPGNVWHFYGRINAAKQQGIPVTSATLSVLLESLLMAAAACFFAMVGFRSWMQFGIAIVILIGIHPIVLNLALKRLQKSNPVQINQYPFLPLMGEMGFLALRAIGFALTFLALRPISGSELPLLFSGFVWAWLLGFIIPGLPGGVGVFEAIAVAVLSQAFSSGQVLGAVALYRLINTVAEGMGAGLAAIDSSRG
ncbi:flippase-like domain-containing protein [Pseudanabaenaceae cyanobacterium LEGE 13415]|nr:flippase-like domain-containing protein [Pseudanabaenaceae cyanobacterium LEGE 13415]